ncbi:MAG: carboxypeptidase regulatory-like domain-containing protein [Terracidiphilus sp.]
MIAALCITLSATSLHAQGYGTISGTVTDPSGAVVTGAGVIATEVQTGNQTRTVSGRDGRFVFPTLLPSGYTLSVTAAGFESYSRTGVVLEADQALTINLVLKIGSQTQTVSVSAEAPQVDTTTGTLSQVINSASVSDLPLNGRAAAQLVTLVAGVVDASNEGNGANQGSGKSFSSTSLSPVQVASVNGTQVNQDNFLLDGGNNLDEMTNINDPYPMPDSVQEFSVQTANYNAEFGQSAGMVVNIVTKSGGEQFHGDLFEYLRNGFFNAENHFNLPGLQDTYHRHQFGGSIGGPVKIPHISSGKTTQFFYGYQYTLIHLGGSTGSFTAPTAAEEGLSSSSTGGAYADFSNLCNSSSGNTFNAAGMCVNSSGAAVTTQQIYNVYTGVAYPNNHIPSSVFDPASVALTKYFPVATSDAGPGKIGNTVSYFAATQNYFNEDTARVDHEFGANDRMFARYFYDWYQQPAIYNVADLRSYASYFQTRYQNALVAETHTFTPNILNNLVLNYQREVSQRGGPPGSFDITALAPNSPLGSLWQPSVGPYMDPIISGYFQASGSASAVFERNNYTFNDDIHWVKGAHNFAFGGHYELSKFDVVNVYNSYGIFDFGTATNPTVANNNAFANYMEGFLTTFEQGEYELCNDRGHFPAIYAEDSWKATHRLTLNYGVRWEMYAPWHNKVGLQTAFSPSEYAADKGTPQYALAAGANTPGLPAGMVLSGDTGFPANGVNNQYKQFMPRVGFAYDVFGNGKTAVRGGYGIFYQTRTQGFFNLSQPTFNPNTLTVGPNSNQDETAGSPGGPFSDPYCIKACTGGVGTITNPFPFTLPFKSNQVFPNNMEVGEYNPSGNFQVPVSTDYNLTIEQQFSAGLAMRLAYVGSASRHLVVFLDNNPDVNTATLNSSGVLTFPGGNSGSTSTSGTGIRRVYNTAPTVGPCLTVAGCNDSYQSIIEAAMIGNAHFNSLQATLQKTMSHGIQFLANYTWSKSYDDLPQQSRTNNNEDINSGESYVYPLYPANMSNAPAGAYAFPDIKALDRGLSDIDHPQVLSLSYVWDLPKVHGGFSVLRALVNDWNTSGTFQHHSGDALTIYTSGDISDTGLSQDRAVRNYAVSPYLKNKNLGGDCSTTPASGATVPKPCESWLNPAAFSIPVNTGAGTGFGNVVKGSLRGPGFTVWNTALTRSFHIWRESSLDFRAEYFDVLNHTILNNPTVSTGSSVSGLASSTSFGNIQTEDSVANNGAGGSAGPRIGQFALKFNF